jgi:hypothetical protein
MVARKIPRTGWWFAAGLVALVFGAASSSAFTLWPFKKKPPPPPQEVQVLGLQSPSGSTPPLKQFWERNVLVVDMQLAGASGAVFLTAPTAGRWPVRISFRAAVGQFAMLEVRGLRRMVLPLRSAGPGPVTVALDHTAWTQQTPQLELIWGAATSGG